MLNPNDTSTVLYPEEIAALLDSGFVAPVPIPAEGPALEVLSPELGDAWLLDVLAKALSPIQEVACLYLAGARPIASDGPADRLLVVVDAPENVAERVARAITLAISRTHRNPRLPLDLSIGLPGSSVEGLSDSCLRYSWTRESVNASNSL
jgi:hypothetical protein